MPPTHHSCHRGGFLVEILILRRWAPPFCLQTEHNPRPKTSLRQLLTLAQQHQLTLRETDHFGGLKITKRWKDEKIWSFIITWRWTNIDLLRLTLKASEGLAALCCTWASQMLVIQALALRTSEPGVLCHHETPSADRTLLSFLPCLKISQD